MKVYIIEVESQITNTVRVSQEGYKTLEAAQAFIRSRRGYNEVGQTIMPNLFEIGEYLYFIKEIDIK